MRPEASRRVSAQQVARELGISQADTDRLLRLHGDWLRSSMRRSGRRWTYDAEIIEILRGLLGQPHRQVSPVETDWLSRYVGGTHE